MSNGLRLLLTLQLNNDATVTNTLTFPEVTATGLPEPGTLLPGAAGLALVLFRRRRWTI
ncbi:MAG: hypothetical protein LAP87_28205 [Acidobacteriia bacterium]|nr:hypothetical protein [Terriglobia bacterium]